VPTFGNTGGGTVVKFMSLALAVLATLGLAAGPGTGLRLSSAQFETLSTLTTGAMLLVLATAVRRQPVRKE
jgi:hypothetical protein